GAVALMDLHVRRAMDGASQLSLDAVRVAVGEARPNADELDGMTLDLLRSALDQRWMRRGQGGGGGRHPPPPPAAPQPRSSPAPPRALAARQQRQPGGRRR